MSIKLRLHHCLLTKATAARVHQQISAQLKLDDIMTIGFLALHDAARRYSRNTKTTFTIYAKNRIRAAMLEWIRVSTDS